MKKKTKAKQANKKKNPKQTKKSVHQASSLFGQTLL
jgi:hypothetical protein